MSIALMTMARKTALPTNLKFTLMALADWADDNGSSCWPSVYELSEYLTCSERTVQRLLRELEADGWIVVVGNANGGASSRRYCLNVPRLGAESQAESERREIEKERRRRDRKNPESNPFLEGCQSVTPDNLSPVTNQVEGVTTTTVRGDSRVTPSTIDPPVDPPEEKKRASAPALPGVDPGLLADYLAVRKDKRAGPLTKTAIAGLQREADKAGLTLEQAITACCEFGWQGFNARWYAERTEGRPALRAAPATKSFAQQEREIDWARWEEMTGEQHPDRLAYEQAHGVVVIDISPRAPNPLEIAQ